MGARYWFVRPNPTDLVELARLVDTGQLVVHVSGTLPLEDAAEAHRQVETGHGTGKIVLEVG